MLPHYKNNKFYCLHCDYPLRVIDRGAQCGICQTTFSTADLEKARMQTLSPREREKEHLADARALLAAQEQSLSDFSVVPMEGSAIPNWKKVFSLIGAPVEEQSYATDVFPYISFAYVIICALVFLGGPALVESFQLQPTNLWRWGGLNFVTYSVTHGGPFHILGNLFFLWPFMDNVEEHLGHAKTFVFIVVAAIASALLHLAMDKSNLPLVGASGVCFAMATLYSIRYPKNRFLIAMPLVGLYAYRIRLRLRARTLFLYYIFLEVIGVFGQNAGITSTSHWGHLGGALAGLGFYFVTRDSLEVSST